ncbi:hypothetical protein LN042_19685 [Kitasatospora sp. RB6PN24]|uniref:hypothetical protein n=1 Tax=Kitasatospora humi TaxID=2893891 RepID=UPI001E4058B7|nr:hypothetical protein [Kitasatospora humi]MCC9309280.1 hypothetical protein [Kitasatospora humi]
MEADKVPAGPPAGKAAPFEHLMTAGSVLHVLKQERQFVLRVAGSGEKVVVYGPWPSRDAAATALHRVAAWMLWPRARVRGAWGCLAHVEEGWATALCFEPLSPLVQMHPDIRAAEEHAARHLIAPDSWSDLSSELPDAIRKIEEQFWVREGYRVLATWATASLGSLVRGAFRGRELARGNYPAVDLAERLAVSPATISAATTGRSWNPPINRQVGVLGERGRRRR